jgi:hypothetical protein
LTQVTAKKYRPGKNVASTADTGNDHGKKNAAFAANPAYLTGFSLEALQALRSNAHSTYQPRACNIGGQKTRTAPSQKSVISPCCRYVTFASRRHSIAP